MRKLKKAFYDVGAVCSGTLEMWVEMMTPQKALEIPRIVLKEASPVGIEIR